MIHLGFVFWFWGGAFAESFFANAADLYLASETSCSWRACELSCKLVSQLFVKHWLLRIVDLKQSEGQLFRKIHVLRIRRFGIKIVLYFFPKRRDSCYLQCSCLNEVKTNKKRLIIYYLSFPFLFLYYLIFFMILRNLFKIFFKKLFKFL